MIRLKSNVILSRPHPVFEKNPNISFVSVFYAGQSKPLSLWEKCGGIGSIRRVEEHSNSSVQLLGTNTGRTKLATPIRPYTTLGIRLPYMVVALKFINRPCGFDIQIEDSKQIRRRFQFTTRLQATRKLDWTALVPLYLEQNWNEIVIDLQAITKRLYGTDYVETVRIQVYPSCRLRMIYFSKFPMQISKALLIMKILLEEGKDVFDVRKLDEEGEDGGVASLAVAVNENSEDRKLGRVENSGSGNESDRDEIPTASAADRSTAGPSTDQPQSMESNPAAATADTAVEDAEAEEEIHQTYAAAISLTSCGTTGSYKIKPTKLAELLPSNEYWSRTRFMKTFGKEEETQGQPEGKIQAIILPLPAFRQGVQLQTQESGKSSVNQRQAQQESPALWFSYNANGSLQAEAEENPEKKERK